MPKIKLGDNYTFVPTGFTGSDYIVKEDRGKTLTGTVVYIHPKCRFFLVEAQCHGRTVRECFQLIGGIPHDEI